ncbi:MULTISPECIES: DUF1232 domain-containing protein [Clostridia]|uniref:YkvA family protein n=1 Tax=Clostridia TaxID=186801 RepID=UPI000EA269FE|nr:MULTISPECIES: DUF1232 domain-containing protein [Clostridia]NBJ71235.1 DUF1232 domain-containing protein [Roseburia sp. 1XD42-34]RKI74978.1 DUF1232 domain-containing protein [Clostridium sp. 1xD42-85]
MKRLWKRVRFLFTFHRSIPFFKDFFTSKEVANTKKLFFVLLLLGYFIFPFDMIPDVILGFGLIDDVSIAVFLLQWMVKMAPEAIKEKYSF